MRRFLVVLVCVGVLLINALIVPSVALGYYTGMSASVVIGQADFSGSAANQGGTPNANTMNNSAGALVIGGKLVVSDITNQRVLIFNSIPTTNNASANTVIGQVDFTHNSANQCGCGTPGANTLFNPGRNSTDGTKLFVTDISNSRILIFNQLPTTNNASADTVIGQADFTHASANQGGTAGANTLNGPRNVYYDPATGKLVVSDLSNNRVLIYNSVPTSNNASANVVVGQTGFSNTSANQGGSASASTLSAPRSVMIANGKLIVADGGNNRILIWNSIPTTNGVAADIVLGQNDFTSTTINAGQGSVNAEGLNLPVYLEVGGNKLFVGDANNGRLLIFSPFPTTSSVNATMVIGRQDLNTGTGGTVSASLTSGTQAPYIYGNMLIDGDNGASRVLIFYDTTITPFINLTSSPTPTDGAGRYRLTGNITMNTNNGTYWLQNFQADVNGTGYGSAPFSSGRNDGSGNSIYDFNYDFDPTVGNGSINNLTIKFLATTQNADTNTLFYFLPFKFNSFNVSSTKSQSFTFSVNKDQLQRVKDNLDHFEVWYKPNTTTGKWTQYISNIPDTQIDQNGLVVATKTSNLTKFIGSYIFKIQAIDNWGNRQDSNYLYTSGYNPITVLTSYPSFGKSFVPLPVPSVTPFPTASPIEILPTATPYVIPTQIALPVSASDQTNNKLYLILATGIGAIIFLLLFLLFRRRRKKEVSNS